MENSELGTAKLKNKRGRPPKKATSTKVQKQRGRPPKKKKSKSS